MGPRKLAVKTRAWQCQECDETLEDESDDCLCMGDLDLQIIVKCPICDENVEGEDAKENDWLECCMWKLMGHASRESLRMRIARGADPIEATFESLLGEGLVREADLVVARSYG